MKKQSELEQFFSNVLKNAEKTNGKIVGQDGDMIKEEIAKDNKGAWVNHLVEQYLKKEVLDEVPEEFNITIQDIVKEISRREIKNIFGK